MLKVIPKVNKKKKKKLADLSAKQVFVLVKNTLSVKINTFCMHKDKKNIMKKLNSH